VEARVLLKDSILSRKAGGGNASGSVPATIVFSRETGWERSHDITALPKHEPVNRWSAKRKLNQIKMRSSQIGKIIETERLLLL
jgi:hypothetical protein